MKFEWSKKLETGIEEIDNQHKGLIENVNKLLLATKKEDKKNEVNNIIKFLSDYVVTHFNTEEEYMQKYDYPGYEEHKRIHKEFVKNFNELVKNKDSLSFTVKLQLQVGEWLINHINMVDKKMAKYLKEKIN